MKRAFFLLAFLFAFTPALAQANPYGDQILVKYRSGTTISERVAIVNGLDGQTLDRYSIVPRLELISADDPRPKAIDQLEGNPDVLWAVPNAIRRTQETVPNDPLFSVLWGQRNTGQTVVVSSIPYTGTPGSDIRATEAWDISRGAPETVVAVIDTGIDLDHPDLEENIWTNTGEVINGVDDDSNGYVDDLHGWDFINNDSDPNDDAGHGTHVSGTIGAVGDNSIGVVGASWRVSMMALKACDNLNRCPIAATIAALEYAVDNGAMISNNSYGGCCGEIEAERLALESAQDAGHLFVASAGNDNANNDNPAVANYPSSYPLDNIIAVAASTMSDSRASFSSYGQETVDLAAPGTQIASTYLDGDYAWSSGTSMASPQVAGVAALVKSRQPSWDYLELADRIIGETRAVSGWGSLTASGGILDAYRALLFAPAAPVITSTPPITTPDQAAEFQFSGEPLAQFECRLDGGSWQACSSPEEYFGLSGGGHQFQVRQSNPTGYPSDPASYSWSIGIPPAEPTIVSGPDSLIRVSSATLSWEGEPGATFQCRLDGGSWEACSSPALLQGLGNGDHQFQVRQVVDGLTSGPSDWLWEVDTDPPAKPEIFSGPSAWSRAATVSWQFSSQVDTDVFCRLDGGSWQACSSPHTIAQPGNGPRLFEVKQSYPDGPSSTISTWSWYADQSKPEIDWARGRKVSGRFQIKNRAHDPGGSGLSKLGVSYGKARPGSSQKAKKVFSYSQTKKISGNKPRWIKVRDRAGNWSSWLRISY
jgi:subtilisin family serine protease